jgi:small ubiquitin-related modifier
MSKVFETYAQRKGVQAASLRFLLDGERILEDQTPKMLELDDQDQIDCMLEQTGGSGSAAIKNTMDLTSDYGYN